MDTDVVILFGGRSSERLVSVASGQNVSRFLPQATPWFLSDQGDVYRVSAHQLAAHHADFSSPFMPGAGAHWSSLGEALDRAPRETVFFLALHGGEGEDGTIQRMMEERGLAFTGSGSVASANAIDKARTKELAGARGVRGAEARVLPFAPAVELEEKLTALFEAHPRWILKPKADGSSHGLIHLASPAQVREAAKTMASLGLEYLAEVFVVGRELTVGVVDEVDGPVALPVSEVLLAKGAAFDFAGKYLGGATEVTPAVLTDAERQAAQAAAVTTHSAVGCYGYSRTDVILTSEGSIALLEINTLPGLTRASFIPQQLAAAGRDVGEFLRAQLALARRRRERSSPHPSPLEP